MPPVRFLFAEKTVDGSGGVNVFVAGL